MPFATLALAHQEQGLEARGGRQLLAGWHGCDSRGPAVGAKWLVHPCLLGLQ